MRERAIDALPMPDAYFWLVLRRFGGDPGSIADIVNGTGIDPDESRAVGPTGEITLGQQLRQLRNLANRQAPGWGLALGEAMSAAAHGDLGVAAASAATLADALSVLERYGHVRAPYFAVRTKADGRRFLLEITPQLRLEPGLWSPLVESLLGSIQALVESALGRPMEEARFAVDYPEPDYADRFRVHLHAPVAFDRPTTAVALPLAWLPLPCPFSDPALHRSALDRLAAAERRLRGEAFIVAQVERILEGASDAGLDLERVARELHLSRRTLVRRLGRSGTSFRALLDAHRERRARALLADPHLSASEIADRLGYTEPANFGRACRRWFGVGPRAYREQRAFAGGSRRDRSGRG